MLFWLKLIIFLVIISGCNKEILEYIDGMNLPIVPSSMYSKFESFFFPKIIAKTIQLDADKNMNNNKEVKVALVTVYDENLYKIINNLTGPAFFQAEQKLKQNYPKKISSIEWKIKPGQILPIQKIKGINKNKAKGAFLFSNYNTPGNHKLKIGNQSHIHLKLRSKEFFILNDQGNYMIDDVEKMANKQEEALKAKADKDNKDGQEATVDKNNKNGKDAVGEINELIDEMTKFGELSKNQSDILKKSIQNSKAGQNVTKNSVDKINKLVDKMNKEGKLTEEEAKSIKQSILSSQNSIFNNMLGKLGDLGIGNIASGNLGVGNTAVGNIASGNLGVGNTASGNLGVGNTASGNLGVGNTASGNNLNKNSESTNMPGIPSIPGMPGNLSGMISNLKSKVGEAAPEGFDF